MVFGWTRLLGNLGMTAIAGEHSASLSTNQTDAHIVLPAKLSNIKKAEEFSSQKLKWNSSEEVLSILISFDKHESWFSKEVTSRPPNGSMFLFNKQKVKDYRKDGYTWKKRTSSSSYIREDHCKLKVYGVNCLNVLYTHSAIIPTFHRRIYWLLQNPDIVLVHYLNLIEEDLTEQVTYAREQKKSNISCQIKSIFSGVAEHLIPNFEITEEDETSSQTSATGSSLQQKKSQNSKKLFRIAIIPSDPLLSQPATTTTAALSELTNCAQSTYLWIRTSNGPSTLTHLPIQTNHSAHQPNLISSHGNLGNRQCDVSFLQSQSTPRSSPRTIQSAVLLTPVCNITSRNSPVKTTGTASSNISLSQQNIRLPGTSSVTSTLNVPVRYQTTTLRSENQIIENGQIVSTSDSRNDNLNTDSVGKDTLSTNSNTRPTYASPCGVATQPLLFFSSSSIPATARSASTLNLPQTGESNPSVDMNYTNFLNNSNCESTSNVATTVNTMCSFTAQGEPTSSSPMDFQFRPLSLPLEGQGNLNQQHNSSFPNTGPVSVSESNLKQTSNDPTLSSNGIPNTSVGDTTSTGKSSENPALSLNNQHSVSGELSSSPSSDYGSLLSESGTRFSGSESSELGSGHESTFDGPFRVPAPVTSTQSNHNSSCFRMNSIFSSSHDMHAPAPQSNDVYQYSRDTSTPLDPNHVDMNFELPELNTFDELDYGTWSDDFSSVLGEYFNNSESVGVDNSVDVRRTISQFAEQQLEGQVPTENSNPKATIRQDDSNKEDNERTVNPDSGDFPPESTLGQTHTSDTSTIPSTLAVSTNVTCLTPVNDVVMTTHDSSQSPCPEKVGYHSDATSFPNASQPVSPSNSLSANKEDHTSDSQDTPVSSSNHERQNSVSEVATVTAVTVMPGSACITDFSPDWSYPEGGVKVLVTGEWSSYDVLYTCLFDGCSVEASLVQVGVLRCYCPPHEPGLVTLQVARNGFIVSNACVFEYRAHDTPGDLNTRHEWLTMDDARFKLALLDRLERLESRLGVQTQNMNPAQSNSGKEQCRTFEERVVMTCRTLLQARFSQGSDLHRPYRGMTLLHLAAALGFSKLVQEMATKWRDPETIEFIRQEIDPTRKDEFNCTPLMWACALGHRAAVTELLCCQANALLVPDACGRLPLQVARDRRYFEVVDCIEEYMATSAERKSLFNLGSFSEDEEDASDSCADSLSTANTPGACGTGVYNSPSLPPNSQPMSVENSYTDRACSPMHVEEVSNGGVLLSQALVQIHEMINEAERQADLENSQLQGLSTRVPMQLSPVHEDTPLLSSPGGWGSSGRRLRSFSSASSQSSPHTPSSKSSLSPGSPGFLNSPHSSPGVPPDTKEFHEFLCSSKKLLEKNFSELTLTDREQQELYQAALIIQEAYRSYKIRRQQRDQEMQAALLIQNHYRKYKQKMTHAALIIQNQYRAYREHEQFKKSRRAAAIIQNQFRIYRRRRQSQKRRDEHKSKQQEARFMRQSSNRSNSSL